MIRKIAVLAPAFCALLAIGAAEAGAQQTIRTPGSASARDRWLTFSYGWDGGITLGPDGRARMDTYPVVREVAADSLAARAGLRAGDVIVSVNGRDGKSPPLFNGIRPGQEVVLRVRRDDEEREITFVRPAATPAAR